MRASKVRSLAQERLAVDAIQREDLDASVVDELRKCDHRAGILVLEEAPLRSREDDDRPPRMAVALVFHRPAEMEAVVLVVGNMHLASGLFGVDEAHGVSEFFEVLRSHLIGVVAHGAAEHVFDRLMAHDLVFMRG